MAKLSDVPNMLSVGARKCDECQVFCRNCFVVTKLQFVLIPATAT